MSNYCLYCFFSPSEISNFQSLVSGPAASPLPGNLLKMKILKHTLDLKTWDEAQQSVF